MYSVIYSATNEPIGIRRLSDGYAMTINDNIPEWKEFLEWNKKQNPPLDLKAKKISKTLEERITAIEIDVTALKAK